VRALLSLAVPLALALLVPVVAPAAPPYPSAGTAAVDGYDSEWNLTNDFFADMYRAGDSTKVVESKLYLRYDCISNTMYVLVVEEPGVIGYIDSLATTSWIAIDAQNHKVVNENAGIDGVPPDFAWIDRGYDGNVQHVHGYEASFTIVPGSYTIIAHTDIWDVTTQTSATSGFPKRGLEILALPSALEAATLGGLKALFR
jgi:hypothetical protein